MPSNQWPFILVLAVGFCPPPAKAGANRVTEEQPPPIHRFLDAKNIALQSLSALILGADLASTKRALEVPGTTEMNPLSRSQGAMLALKMAGSALELGLTYMTHQSGHHKLERAIPLIFATPSAIAAVHNSRIHR
jgi:hypothetical protein